MSHWEPLGTGCRVLVTKEHGFTTDTLLLAHFSAPKAGEVCADLGTGCGVIPLLWKSRGTPGHILALELQEDAAVLARQSVEENGFAGDIEVVCGDVRDYKALLPHQGFHLMACNPPYYAPGAGDPGEGSRRTARHGETLALEDLTGAAGYGLRFGGRLCVCLPAERMAEAMELFRQKGLEPKRLRLVQSLPEKGPYLFLLECRKGGKTGLTVEPTLVIGGGNGEFSPEMLELYGEYALSSGEEEHRGT